MLEGRSKAVCQCLIKVYDTNTNAAILIKITVTALRIGCFIYQAYSIESSDYDGLVVMTYSFVFARVIPEQDECIRKGTSGDDARGRQLPKVLIFLRKLRADLFSLEE